MKKPGNSSKMPFPGCFCKNVKNIYKKVQGDSIYFFWGIIYAAHFFCFLGLLCFWLLTYFVESGNSPTHRLPKGTTQGGKGGGTNKPDKNRHSLPLFPLRFSPLDSPFLNPLFPNFADFSRQVFLESSTGCPYQPVAGNNSGAWLSTETGSFPLYKSKCCCPGFFCKKPWQSALSGI